jgi:photosystem II stability/assembly factor-like uncharacterized protein
MNANYPANFNRTFKLAAITLAIVGLASWAPGVIEASPRSDSAQQQDLDPDLVTKLEFRGIGPYRGGRSTAVAGIPGRPYEFFMGTTGGGVWKTEDGGVSWKNLSDKALGAASIGAVAVAASDPNVVYVGTGSACPRGNVSPGDGMYRSTDGGKSWTHIGLEEAGQIARIRVHPRDPDRVWVAALGHIFGPNAQRGVFHSKDGGKSWDRVLHVSDKAGAVDLANSPNNPRVLFAALWQTERKPWTLTSGGEDSGLYRSGDGGQTWQRIEDGLPSGKLGRIGVTVSPADPERVWALVEADDGGLFRSDDGGSTFKRINTDRNFRQRAWYYTHVFADPSDRNTVYILNVGMWRSVDGGKTFSYVRGPHGDHHDLWISPDNPDIMVNANDGGATVTYTGGRTWSSQGNQPTAEMYRVSVDQQVPYRVYGCQQDNSCVSLPSRSLGSSIARHDWWEIGGCESGHVAIDPRAPNITYSGCYGGQISRFDHDTGQNRQILTYPQLAIGQAAEDLRYRFQWNAPIRISPHDPSVLYHTSQHVHRTQNEGQNWEVISPDLSRNDKEKQGYAGGPLTLDNTGVEVYGTVFAFEESPHTAGLLWAGTDDGLIHISRDNGSTWTDITPSKMPEWGQVNMIELSAHEPGRAFVAVTRYKFDDFQPYLFRTNDYGSSWERISDGSRGIAPNHFTRVVREDPERRGLLFAGTEFGLYISFDDGSTWSGFQQNLPISPSTDLAITQGDLVVATQGRSFWILDDLSVLRQLDDKIRNATAHLFAPRRALRYGGGWSFSQQTSAGKNPPYGAPINYWLSEDSEQEIVLEILDSDGEILRSLSSQHEEPQAPDPYQDFRPEAPPSTMLGASKGLNRYVWNLRLRDAELVEDAVLWGSGKGPRVPPGEYRVRLTIGEWSQSQDVEVAMNPEVQATEEDLVAQYELSKQIWMMLSDTHRALARLRDARQQVADLSQRMEDAGLGEGVGEIVKRIDSSFSSFESRIYQGKSQAPQDILNYPPQLDGQLLDLLEVVQSADARPTAGAIERFADLEKEIRDFIDEVETTLENELGAFNEMVRGRDVPAVIVPSS